MAPEIAPPQDKSNLPLWHCVYFGDNFRCTYDNTKLIRRRCDDMGAVPGNRQPKASQLYAAHVEDGLFAWDQCNEFNESQEAFDPPVVHTISKTKGGLLRFYA